MTRTRLVGAIVGAVIVAACGAHRTPEPPPDPIVAAACPADGTGLGVGSPPGPASGSRPAGFEPVRALRCRVDHRQTPDPDRITIVEERGPISADLAGALALSDEPRSQACPVNHPTPPYLLLVDATGRAYRPRLPQTGCADTRPEVLSAVDANRWTVRRTFAVRKPG